MNITEEVKNLIGQPENQSLEYKAVLPPSRTIAQIISSFANTDGGFLILGVTDDQQINGISTDFHANGIVHKALDSLSTKPQAVYQYISINGKKLYVVKVQKSNTKVTLEDKVYIRVKDRTTLSNPVRLL
ncbi:MAG: ATP-binding protein [Flavobacteriaceae bacterium]|nr:ATP-binding protein [Flavobacteriaceae bacterium]